MNTIADILGVNNRSIEFLNMVEFLFGGNLNYFIDCCKDRSSLYMHTFLYDYRKDMIKQTRFTSFAEFNDTYIKDRKSCLERLFQEYLSDAKMNQLKCEDAYAIYNKHLEDPEIRFARFAMGFM